LTKLIAAAFILTPGQLGVLGPVNTKVPEQEEGVSFGCGYDTIATGLAANLNCKTLSVTLITSRETHSWQACSGISK
jgi:hypothetical protein